MTTAMEMCVPCRKIFFSGRMTGCDLVDSDSGKLVETFGIQELMAATHEEMRTAGPAVVEIPVPEMPSPYRPIRPSRVRVKPGSVPDGKSPPKAR